MIYGMMRDVSDLLTAKDFPVVFDYAPLPLVSDIVPGVPRLTASRDAQQGDLVGIAQGTAKVLRRDLGVRAVLYVSSSTQLARLGDHEYLCEKYVDALLCAINHWCIAGRAGVPAFRETRYLRAEELGADWERWPGVAYLVRFAIGRGVKEINFAAQGRERITLAGGRNRVEVETTDPDAPRIVLMPDAVPDT